MKHARPLLAFCFLAFLALAGPARAQYMWLDSNGDGINDATDVLNPVGVPTTVDVYLDTAYNKDGSLANCDTGDGYLSFSMYFFNVAVTNGTAAFSDFQNLQPGLTVTFGADSSSTEYAHGWGAAPWNPPGTYHLARFTVTLLTSTAPGATLNIVANNHLSTSVSSEETEFMTSCSGLDFDNTYKLGPNSYGSTDWRDTAGLLTPVAATIPVSAAPVAKLAITAAPNPLNPSTDLKFTTTRPGRVTLRIFDLAGQLVKVLADEAMEAGPHALRWDGSDASGGRVSSGVYFVRLSAPEGEARRIVTVLK